jgi:integrase
MKYAFTKDALRSVPTTGERYEIRTTEPGLIGRMSRNGELSLIYRYSLNGTRRKFTVGVVTEDNVPKLKKKYLRERGKVAAGIDPLVERDEIRAVAQEKKQSKKINPTLVQASREYIANYVRKGIGRGGDKEGIPLKRPRDSDSLFKNYIDGQTWALYPLNKVSNDNLADAITEVAEEGFTNTANKLRIFLSGVYNYSKKSPRRWITKGDVAEALDDLPTYGNRKRDRVLWSPEDPSELRAFITALHEASYAPTIKKAIWMLLLGQRRMETVSMTGDEFKCDELNNHAIWWVIPKSKTKNGREHRVFLPEQFRVIDADAGYAFGAMRGHAGHLDASTLSHRVGDLYKAAGIKDAVLHDLRRTVGTFIQAKYGKDIMHVCLNHKSGGLTETYGLYDYDQEKRLAFTAWANELDRIMSVPSRKVVNF